MYPYKGDNDCGLFKTQWKEACDTAEGKKWAISECNILNSVSFGSLTGIWCLDVELISLSVLWQKSPGMVVKNLSFKNCWWSLKWHDKVMAASERMGGGNERGRLHLVFCMRGVCIISYSEWTDACQSTVGKQYEKGRCIFIFLNRSQLRVKSTGVIRAD